jgi:hypothetical protein
VSKCSSRYSPRSKSFRGQETRFDYRAKPGPVTKSNQLALMRAVGLELEG